MEKTTKKSSRYSLGRIAKLLVTLCALYYVFTQIDIYALWELLKTSNPLWLFGALVAFNASKILSAVRLNRYFAAIGIVLSEINNIRLYYLGMFYNLFLPGGISGDGYKIYLLAKRNSCGYTKLLQATILDRISGLSALLSLAGVLFALSTFASLHYALPSLGWIDALLAIPAIYIITKRFFGVYLNIFAVTTTLAFGVQLLQLLCALLIIWALPQMDISTIDYLTLFLISSVVAVLPISVGGIGVRELTFLYGFGLIGADVTAGVGFSILFFLITAISSMFGLFVKNDF